MANSSLIIADILDLLIAIIKFLFNSAYSKPKKITNEMVKKLTDLHYKEDILKLEKLIDKDLKYWLS